jgi:RNA polymerase sigma-70 factor (ECF subfamily)
MTSHALRHIADLPPNPPGGRGAAREAPRAHVLSVDDVYEKYFDYVYRCLRHLGVSESGLDDATQDVFVVVNNKLSEFDGNAAITTWLYAIVIRVARRYRERQAQAHRFESSDPLVSEGTSEQELDARRKLAFARSVLDSLDEAKREVFVLSEIEQMAAPEIAAITGVPLNTVYSRLRAAKLAFANAVRKQTLRQGGLHD